MGRVKSSDAEENHDTTSTMRHISHPHELELCNNNSPQAPNATTLCSACKNQPSGNIYICKPCNFILHSTCAHLPHLITHPSHSNHALTLLPTSSYPGGKFNCDACNRRGDGFSYHCNICDYDLHVLCASKPLKITHHLHPCLLELAFQDPYKSSKGFSCDVCSKMGSKQWLYRCSACEFDVHLDCATATSTPRSTPIQHHNSFPGATLHNQFQAPIDFVQPAPYMHSASMGAVPVHQSLFQPPITAGQAYGPGGPSQLVHSASTGSMPSFKPPMGTAPNNQVSMANELVNSAMQGAVEGVAQQVGQTLMQSFFGGGDN